MKNIFSRRHIGINAGEREEMLRQIGVDSLDQLIFETIPDSIRIKEELNIPAHLTESEYLHQMKAVAAKNKVFRSYIGMGYYSAITPSVILRNIFENPGWYTQYTPYQAEVSQGRLEALLNFQTLVSDLTAMPIANASLLDEGTAASEAMRMFFDLKNKRVKGDPVNVFWVSDQVFPQTLAVVESRAEPMGIAVKVAPVSEFDLNENTFGILLQYPAANGDVIDYSDLTAEANEKGIFVTVAADLLSLTLLKAPGEWGADAVVGNTQRFGVPIGFGGPHAAYFATSDKYKRQLPGRIIGVSKDARGKLAYRMALQTREQHIRREKATSNICTAQALLAIMAGAYAVYHGKDGVKEIATTIHTTTNSLAQTLISLGYSINNQYYFDTLSIATDTATQEAIRTAALDKEINFYYTEGSTQVSIDETVTTRDLQDIVSIFASAKGVEEVTIVEGSTAIAENMVRQSDYLTHEVFNSYHTETKMMRYLKRLENKDISLVHSMIPLGSCTMKLNAASELMPVSWPAFSTLHPFVPADQSLGYQEIIHELEDYLSEITGFAACSLQPNSGAQGEYAGLMAIRAYHLDRGDDHRNIALIPSSAHGTNPASAILAGMKVVVVKCDDHGNIDVEDLKAKAEKHTNDLAALLVTYPSTHGVFETAIIEICNTIHQNGGLVYMDGANMNAQVGFTNPGMIGADVCHLNLHKTFAIPHGGGGPGVGPICVNEKLKPYLPGHFAMINNPEKAIKAVSAAPYGSASVALISYAYIKMLGRDGLKQSTAHAILNANYIKARVQDEYDVLYAGDMGRCAHELIVDLRPYKDVVSAEDVAKRLMDYSFHAPTLSFPVAGTIMIEPTESESKDELDRFCDALLQIKKEIMAIRNGQANPESNVLSNAPHPVDLVTATEWPFDYSREEAAYPLPYLRNYGKFWPSVARVDNAYGDRNLVCSCLPIEAYMEEEV